MKLQDQVCTLEQAKRLKELGVVIPLNFFYQELDDGSFELNDRAGVLQILSDIAVDAKKESEGVEDGQWFQYNKEEFLGYAEQALLPAIEAGMITPAFTVAELGALLGEGYCSGNGTHSMATKWCDRIENGGANPFVGAYCKIAGTEAEARAAMLIYLLENKLTTPEECNKRLSQS